jgi:hypothetical protein
MTGNFVTGFLSGMATNIAADAIVNEDMSRLRKNLIVAFLIAFFVIVFWRER